MKTRQRIEAFLQENPAATYREIMAALDIKSTSTVNFHMNKIKRPTGKERLKQLVKKNAELREALGCAEAALCQQGLQATYPGIIAKARAALRDS